MNATYRLLLQTFKLRNSAGERTDAASSGDVKTKVLRWLMSHSQHLITASRFPLDEVIN